MKECKYCPSIFLSFVSIIIFLLGLLPLILEYSESLEYDSDYCNITHIEYPQSLPTPSNTIGWEECDCGKKCTSWSPCINLYAEEYPNILIRQSLKKDSSSCTFHDEDCRDGEDYTIINNYFIDANETYNSYINKTLECYVNKDKTKILLDADVNVNTIYILTGVCSFLIGISILAYPCNFRKKNKEVVVNHYDNPAYTV